MNRVGVPTASDSGLWSVGVFPGHADELLDALDPAAPFVVIECGDPSLGWHDAMVTIGPESKPSIRRVRNLAFDVMVSSVEAAGLGGLLRAQHDGQLRAVQLKREPKLRFRLPGADRGLAQAMRGLGVHLTIDLPHDAEVADVRATEVATLEAFVQRL